ncbi:MAG: hypothetical protein ACRC0G_13240 [Fusobacteriaceae bacterium]
MNKRKLIRGFKSADFNNKHHEKLTQVYNLSTFSKSNAVSNLADLISDLDKLVEVGYYEYLGYLELKLVECEDILLDTMHLRNLFILNDKDLENLVLEEKKAYVCRADLKMEILFVSTNESHVRNLLSSINKINSFNERKNERFYTLKRLTKFEKLMGDEN